MGQFSVAKEKTTSLLIFHIEQILVMILMSFKILPNEIKF
jgi:hypothetical protein